MSQPEQGSDLKFLHQVSNVSIKDGKKVVHEEQVIHGERGLKFKYYHKEGDKVEKITGIQKPDGSWVIITVDGGDKKEEENVTKEDVLKLLKKEKHLAFALEYIKDVKGGLRRMRRSSRSSRKGSKKGSRKMSRSKRGSKKGSKKGSRKH